MAASSVIGWDLGGAHLKAARLGPSGVIEQVVQLPCPLWQGLDRLEVGLEQAREALGSAPVHAVTMTGEMVDLFSSRGEGVARLVAEMRDRFPRAVMRFYAGGSDFLDAGEATGAGARIASANWMASAAFVARRVNDALLVDIGSTTVDLVPIREGQPRPRARDDSARLVAGELLYTGVTRTPVMVLAEAAPFDGEWIPLMAEHFATIADVYRLTGQLPEGADLYPPADGGEKSELASARRLARMIGRDVESAPMTAWRRLAGWFASVQTRRLEDACERLLSRDPLPDQAPVVAAGVGRFLLPAISARFGRSSIAFGSLLPCSDGARERASDCAPAVAVAWLAQRRSA